jgi:tetratricopeptide (TPR) repeat protein
VHAAIAYVQRRQGKWEEAAAHLQAATLRDPQNISYLIGLAETASARRRYADAQALLDRALAISPDRTNLRLQKAVLYQNQGDLDAAQAILDALPSDAVSTDTVTVRGTQLFYRHQYAPLATLMRQFLQQPDPNLSVALPGLYSLLGAAELYAGDRSAAQRTFTTAKAHALELRRDGIDTSNLACNLGLIDAALGERAAALEEARRCVRLSSGDHWQNAQDQVGQAKIEAIVGEREAVLTALPQLLATPNGINVGDLRFSPVWDALRGDPRFEKLIAAGRAQ